MRRWIPLLLVFTTIAGLAVWLFVRDREPNPSGADPVEDSRLAQPAVEADSRSSDEEQPPMDATPASPAPEATPEVVDTPSEPAAIPAGVRGRIVVVDAEGVEHESESGTMQLFVPVSERGGASFGHAVTVEQGAWNLSVTGGLDHVRDLSVGDIRLGGRTAVLEGGPFATVSVLPGETVTIRVRWTQGTLLHVVDAATGAPLDGVEVREGLGYPYDDHGHPGVLHNTVILEGGTSPVEIEPAVRDRSVFVRSPGYAWGVIALTPTGGDRTIELVASGQLNIRLVHDTDDSEATLRVYESLEIDSEDMLAADDEIREAVALATPEEREQMRQDLEEMRKALPPEDVAVFDGLAALLRGESPTTVMPALSPAPVTGTPMIEVPVGERSFVELDSMAPGTYVARVELGRWYRDPTILAQEAVSVTAGGISETELQWQAPVVPDPGTLALTVACPVAWRECQSSVLFSMNMVSLRYRGKPTGSSSDRQRLTAGEPREVGELVLFDFGVVELPPGFHIASIGSFDYQSMVEVREGERGEHTIRIPDPARLVVTAVDIETGQPVPVESLGWHPKRPRQSMSGSLERVFPEGESSRFEFCAPVGTIEISLDGPYRVHRDLEVVPGVNEVTLEANAVSKISFTFRDGDSLVPLDELAQVDAEPIEGEGGVVMWGGASVWVEAPGFYRVVIPDVEGYAPIPPQEIRVEKERDVERTIELVPDRARR